MCGVRGVKGRPATMSRCRGVTATFPASASRWRGVEGVGACFSDNATSAFAGEFSFAAERGGRDADATCLTLFPRFADGFSAASSSTSIASPWCTVFFGVTNGFSCSASSRITNCARRLERVATFDGESSKRVRNVSLMERALHLLGASALAELRVLFPRTVGAIVDAEEGSVGVGGVEGTMWRGRT